MLPGETTIFVRAAECGGFSQAARDLGLTPSAVSKAIQRLESRLNVSLFMRTTRQFALTAEGEWFLARCQAILADVASAEEQVSAFAQSPTGLLRVNTGLTFGLKYLVPALPAFLERFPRLRVELSLADGLVDLMEDRSDVAVRLGAMANCRLIARHICDVERTVCASPAYLERRGVPREPDELLNHNCLTVSHAPSLRTWSFKTRDGTRAVEVSGTVAANNAESLLQLALGGVGIVRLGDLILREHLAQGRLVPVLGEFACADPAPLYALYHPLRHRSPRIRAIVEFLVERFAHKPWCASRTALP